MLVRYSYLECSLLLFCFLYNIAHNFLVKRLESCHCLHLIFCCCEQPGFQVLLGDYDFVTFATNLPWDFSRTKFDYSSATKRGTVGYRPIEVWVCFIILVYYITFVVKF